MTDILAGGFIREGLFNDAAFALFVGGFVRESLSHDVRPPTNLNVGGLIRESLSKDIAPPTELRVSDLTREALITGTEPPPVPVVSSFIMGAFEIEHFSPDVPLVFLRYSDDAGASWSNRLAEPLGREGEFSHNVSWARLGTARYRVFELSWSTPCLTAVTGVFVEAGPAAS